MRLRMLTLAEPRLHTARYRRRDGMTGRQQTMGTRRNKGQCRGASVLGVAGAASEDKGMEGGGGGS